LVSKREEIGENRNEFFPGGMEQGSDFRKAYEMAGWNIIPACHWYETENWQSWKDFAVIKESTT
jgi:hypothetical protein